MDDAPMPMDGSREPGSRAGGSGADVFSPGPDLTTGQLWTGLAFYLVVGVVILAAGLLSSSAMRWPLVVVGALVLVVHLVRYGRFMVRH